MRRNLLVAVLVGTGLSFTMWGTSAAQSGGARSVVPEARIALVDVAYIFKKYDKFTRLYESMKSEVKQREKEIADAQSELKVLMNSKQQLTPDTPDYRKIEQRIVQKKGEIELAAENARREFTQKEANLYHQTYQEVEAEITKYAERNSFTLVLRASRDSDAGSTNPQDVIKEVSQMVIYSLPNMDITEAILASLNAQGTVKKPAGPSSTKPTQTTNQKDANKPQLPSGTKK